MASSNSNERKITAKTQTKVLGKTEVEWEIDGWGGSMAHQVRSKASCFANVPVSGDGDSSSQLRLRFHLRPYHCHGEPDQKFCQHRNQYVTRSSVCRCSTCKTVPLSATSADVPVEFMPKCPTRSAGYSLLVDVLNNDAQNDVTLGVTVAKLNGDACAISDQKFASLEPGSPHKDLSVVDNFWRMLKWTEDKSGNISNCVTTRADTVENARFLLTVTAYQFEVCGTDAPISQLIPDTRKVLIADEKPNGKLEGHLDPSSDVLETVDVPQAKEQPEVPVVSTSKPENKKPLSVWRGTLEWQNEPHEEVSSDERQMKCPAKASMRDDGLPQPVTMDDLPSKLVMRFIPKDVLLMAKTGLQPDKMKIVYFFGKDGPAQDSLIRILANGKVGIVLLSGTEFDVKPRFVTLILHYSTNKKMMWGTIRVDQPEFVSRLAEGMRIYHQQQTGLSNWHLVKGRKMMEPKIQTLDLMLQLEILRRQQRQQEKLVNVNRENDESKSFESDLELLTPEEQLAFYID